VAVSFLTARYSCGWWKGISSEPNRCLQLVEMTRQRLVDLAVSENTSETGSRRRGVANLARIWPQGGLSVSCGYRVPFPADLQQIQWSLGERRAVSSDSANALTAPASSRQDATVRTPIGRFRYAAKSRSGEKPSFVITAGRRSKTEASAAILAGLWKQARAPMSRA